MSRAGAAAVSALLLLLAGSSGAVTIPSDPPAGDAFPSGTLAPEILRPRTAGVEEDVALEAARTVPRRSAAEAFWRREAGARGDRLKVRWNVATGLPHRIYGPGLRVTERDARLSTAADAEARGRAFLARTGPGWAGEESPAPADLDLVKAHRVGATWFLVFQQRYRGLEVEGGRVDLRMREDGTLILFGSDWFPGVSVDPVGRFAQGVADAQARLAVGFEAATDHALGGERVILPLPGPEGAIEYRLVHRVRHRIASPPALWRSYVDANTGEILARENDLRYDTLVGRVEGRIHPATPTDPFVTVPFRDHVATTTLDSTFTDANGRYERPNTITGTVMGFGLRGPFLEVIHNVLNEASQQTASPANDTLDVLWTPANSDTAERDTWFHAHVAREYVKGIDPGFTALDYRMPCTVNINAVCNAFWDGVGINFYRWGIRPSDGRACANTGTIADVIYHEFGHGRTQEVWAPLFPSGAMHEGFSDYLAATITNQPVIGRGFFGPNTSIRTADNTNQIDAPACLGAVHCVGTAIAGSLWDTREALIAALGDSATAIGLADSLFHYAGYGAAPWHDDYLLDLLVVDDDDGTLLNGTPHFGQICPSFAAHGIPCPDTTSGVWIVHAPLPDVGINEGPLLVQARMGSFGGALLAGMAQLHYRIPDDVLPPPGFSSVTMNHVGGDVYEALIHVGLLTGRVEYYLTAADAEGSTAASPPDAPASVHTFEVGYLTTLWADDFETDRGWVSSTNGATGGRWMRVDPHGTPDDSDPTFFYQTEDDHTPDPGAFCYVTGDTTAGQPIGIADVDGGCVTLLSPLIDLEGRTNARLEYWRWFTDETRYDDTLSVAVSSDGGANWIELERQPFTQNTWLGRSFDLDEYIPLTAQLRLRVVACDAGGGSLVEAALDDVSITTRLNGLVSTGDGPGGDAGDLPQVAFLGRPVPNPAGARVRMRVDFGVPRAAAGDVAEVRLVVLDVRGRVVRTLLSDPLAPGRYAAVWDGAGDGGERAAAGVYFLRLRVDGVTRTVKAVRLD